MTPVGGALALQGCRHPFGPPMVARSGFLVPRLLRCMSPDRDSPSTPPPHPAPSSDRPALEPGGDPPWLRTIRQLREAFDLIFPALVALILAAVAVLLVVRPELRGDAAALATLGSVLLGLAGVGLKRRGAP